MSVTPHDQKLIGLEIGKNKTHACVASVLPASRHLFHPVTEPDTSSLGVSTTYVQGGMFYSRERLTFISGNTKICASDFWPT